jgi:glyoxylase-like metal-dependent hydrolase (beta-lactamase superfamily II)
MIRNTKLAFAQKKIPTPFPVGPVNCYVIKEEPVTIIDPGPDYPAAREALVRALNEEGLSPEDVKRVLITHGHSDHGGLAGWLGELGAQVILHEQEAVRLQEQDFLARRGPMFLAAGLPSQIINQLAPISDKMTCFNSELEHFLLLTGGDTIPFENHTLEVLATPGHSGGHLAFYEPEGGILFAGDTLLEHISPNPFPEPDSAHPSGRSISLQHFLNSLNHLKELPVDTVYPGHGKPFTEMKQRIAEIEEHHSKRLVQILKLLDEPLSPYELSQRLYGRLKGADIFMSVSEACAHIDVLVDRGLVEEIKAPDGLNRYQSIKKDF